jgi:hypothetical protein
MLDFAPHGVCSLWDRNLVILHVASDSAITLFLHVILLAFVMVKYDMILSQ